MLLSLDFGRSANLTGCDWLHRERVDDDNIGTRDKDGVCAPFTSVGCYYFCPKLEIKNRARNRAGVFCRSSFLSWFVFARTSVLKGLSPTFSQQTGVPLIHLGGIERAPPAWFLDTYISSALVHCAWCAVRNGSWHVN